MRLGNLRRPLKNVNFCSGSRKMKNLTAGIYGIFRGLDFESDAEIGQKRAVFKGLPHLYREGSSWVKTA